MKGDSLNKSRRNFYKIVFVSVFIIAAISAAMAQDKQNKPDKQDKANLKIALSRSSVISMITVYPGNKIYSLFGHSAFRIVDSENGIDRMYNYGTFDFSDDFFVLKFIEGKLDYYLDIDSFQRALRFYSNIEHRKVYEQILDFDLEQRQTLFDFLEKNGEPENRVYRYDFIWDNCSTRIANAIDKTFPNLVDYSAYKGSGKSFRKMIMDYLGEHPFTNFGIQLVFGKVTDRAPRGSEIFFLPIYMKQGFSAAVMKNKENKTVPLVLKESMIASPENFFHKKPDYPLFIFLGVLILYLVSLVLKYGKTVFRGKGFLPQKNSVLLKLSGIVAALCESFIFLFAGIIGILITYLWFFSAHTVVVFNFNYLWCTPLSLILFAGIFSKKKSSKKQLFFNGLSLVMCLAYVVCIAAGLQYALPAFFPIIIFLIIAGAKNILTGRI